MGLGSTVVLSNFGTGTMSVLALLFLLLEELVTKLMAGGSLLPWSCDQWRKGVRELSCASCSCWDPVPSRGHILQGPHDGAERRLYSLQAL